MQDSDIAIGWVNGNGTPVLSVCLCVCLGVCARVCIIISAVPLQCVLFPQDHYALKKSRPPIDSDPSVGGRDGDWVLHNGRFDGTWTILEFGRKLETGDIKGDIDIEEVHILLKLCKLLVCVPIVALV